MTNLEANYNRAWNGYGKMLLRGNRRAANGYARLIPAILWQAVSQNEGWATSP